MGNNGRLNGFKSSLWEGGHRVPAIAWFPKKIKPGSVSNSTILSMDILPTFLSVAGITVPDDFDGKNFSKVIFENQPLDERPVFWRYRNQWAVRKNEWKYLKLKDMEYLFDLKNDIEEKQNLIEKNPLKAEELKNLLLEWEKEMSKYKLQTD